MKKIVFFDVDGTIKPHGSSNLGADVFEQVQLLKANGYYVALATGRNVGMIQSILSELDVFTYVAINGQYVVFENQVIYDHPIPKEQVKRIVDEFKKGNIAYTFVGKEEFRVSTIEHPVLIEAFEQLGISIPIVDEDYYLKDDIYQIWAYELDKINQVHERLIDLKYYNWGSIDCLEITNQNTSKAEGIKRLIEALSIDLLDTYAFGDANNDIEMFQLVQTSIAMGDATEELKQIATFVTKDANDYGITHAIFSLKMISE